MLGNFCYDYYNYCTILITFCSGMAFCWAQMAITTFAISHRSKGLKLFSIHRYTHNHITKVFCWKGGKLHIVEAKLIKTVANEEWFIKHISTKNKLSKNKLHTSSTGNNATLVPMSKITKTDFASENGPSENCICRYVGTLIEIFETFMLKISAILEWNFAFFIFRLLFS